MSTIGDTQATSAEQAAADSFASRMVNIMNDAAVALLVSIGHQTLLFDVLATPPPARSTAIADAAGLDERYVREWLGGSCLRELLPTRRNHKSMRCPRITLPRSLAPAA